VIELTDSQPTPQQIVAEANAKIQELCRMAFEKGVAVGFQSGFEAAIHAMTATQPSEVLFTKPNDA
jgi:hypothetical protein